ncbi:Glyoxysomal fatty acid beta-oxidation multifunctional protein MFP-a [Capsicum baccatum]|uniref:Glyoxysomal fatty acid beta-oxidation multifunctional protein MFP-a n=1 Tax=Capsicum baccatum TaxID=33114 RepID=A0A2G2VGY1_CAPBA|nr:Glyoxysomal fatty acid beta-oxidation multifunctional protein MFP-a [Capsicum baccatum]
MGKVNMQQSRLSKVNIYPTTCANDIEANPSAEGGEEDEGVDDQAVKVVNAVDDFRIQRFQKTKEDECFKKFFEAFRELHINLPLLDISQGMLKELEQLLMPKNSGSLPLVQWPLFLLASKSVESKYLQDELLDRISSDDYMKYVVEDGYYAIKFVLTSILNDEGNNEGKKCPAHVMPLLEIVQTQNTSSQVIVDLLDVGKNIKKTPVVVRNCTGFIVNRMFFLCTQATLLLVEHGADIYCIDRAFAKFGMAMGSFRVMELTSESVYGTVSSAIMKLPDTNYVATGYVKSETVDPSIKMGNMLLGSEGSVKISQVVDNQNYKEGGTFENSNLTTNIMETSSPFMERKNNESMDLGLSTMSSKGIMLEDQSVEIHVYMGDIEEILDEFMIPLNSEVNDGSLEEELGNFGKSEALVEIRIQDGHFLYPAATTIHRVEWSPKLHKANSHPPVSFKLYCKIEFVIDHALHFGVHRSLTVTEKRVALKEVFPQLMFQNSTLYSWERITIASAFETISSGDFSRR